MILANLVGVLQQVPGLSAQLKRYHFIIARRRLSLQSAALFPYFAHSPLVIHAEFLQLFDLSLHRLTGGTIGISPHRGHRELLSRKRRSISTVLVQQPRELCISCCILGLSRFNVCSQSPHVLHILVDAGGIGLSPQCRSPADHVSIGSFA